MTAKKSTKKASKVEEAEEDELEPELSTLEDFLHEEVAEIAKSTSANVQEFAAHLAKELARAGEAGDAQALKELKATARALAGSQKLRIDEAGWRMLDFAIDTAVRTVVAFLG